jgi:PAS domain S-box-containing protein
MKKESLKNTERHQSSELERELASRVELEKLVAEVAISFHVSNVDELDKAIDSALAKIGEYIGADRSCFFRYNHETGTVSITHEWCLRKIDSQKHLLMDVPYSPFAWSIKMLAENGLLDIPRTSDLPEEATMEKQLFIQQGVQSNFQLNIMGQDGKPLGLLGFDAIRSVHPWRNEDHYLLKIVSRIFEVAFEQIHMVAALKKSEATKQAILNSMPDLIFVINREGSIISHHSHSETELIMDESEIDGSTVWETLSPTMHDPLRKAIEQAFHLGTAKPFEYSLEFSGGRIAYYEGRLAKVDEEYVLALVRNITENKRSEEALKWFSSQLSVVEEQQRRDLASQLHDGVSQELAAASIKLQQSMIHASGEALSELQDIHGLIQGSIGHVQRLTTDLSPPVLYELGIVPALSSLADSLSKQSGIGISFDPPVQSVTLGQSRSIHLYRIARELIVNAIKHSESDKIRVSLEADEIFARLIVSDKGKGIDPELIEMKSEVAETGFGLFSIRQRLEPLGGRMEIRNTDGTEIRIWIPQLAESAKESRET